MTTDISKLPLNKVNLGAQSPSYNVKWTLYRDFTPMLKSGELPYPEDVQTLPEMKSAVCYSGLIGQYATLKKGITKPNRLYTELTLNTEPNNKNIPVLLRREMREWVKICVDHGMLPTHVDPIKAVPSTKKGIMVLDLLEADSTFTYLYLAMFRHIREHPTLVKSMLFLHKEHGVDFHIAYVLASSFNIDAEGHHPIKVTRSPYSPNKPVPKRMNEQLNLRAACSLYRAINEEGTVDVISFDDAPRWSCNEKISTICKQDFIVPIADLMDEELIKMVHSTDDREAIKHFELYKKNKKERDLGVGKGIIKKVTSKFRTMKA